MNFLAAADPRMCVDVTDDSSDDGANIQVWGCSHSAAQSFRFEDVSPGNTRIVHNKSGKCVDVAHAGRADATNIQLWSCDPSKAQLFRVEDFGGSDLRIVDIASGKCVTLERLQGGPIEGHSNVLLWSCNGSRDQVWQAKRASATTF